MRVGTLVSFLVLFLILNSSQKIEKERTLPNLFDDASITLIKARQGHYKKIKLHANIPDKHRCKNTQKTLANQIQHYIKIIIHHAHMAFIPGMQG